MCNKQLTPREKQIAELCCMGKVNKDIAQILNLSCRTVETHKSNIFKKLGIHSTLELIYQMSKLK